MPPHPKIELHIREDCIDVWFGYRHWMTIYVAEDGGFSVRTRHFDDIHWTDTYERQLKIAVQTQVTIRDEEDPLALPRLVNDRGAKVDTLYEPRAKKKAHTSGGASEERIVEHERDKILHLVLEGRTLFPHRSKTEIAEETKNIAERLGVREMAVAGVRAALTRGVYGDPDVLINNTRIRLEKEAVGGKGLTTGSHMGTAAEAGEALPE